VAVLEMKKNLTVNSICYNMNYIKIIVFVGVVSVSVGILFLIVQLLYYASGDNTSIYYIYGDNNQSIGTLKGANPFDVNIPIYSLCFSLVGLLMSCFVLFSSSEVIADENKERKVRDIGNRLEKFYKPTEEILKDTYNLNYNINQIVINLRKLKRHDHLAKDLEARNLFRECTEIKNKNSEVLKKELKKLRDVVEGEIINYEKELDGTKL
jgi:hypothetical protein